MSSFPAPSSKKIRWQWRRGVYVLHDLAFSGKIFLDIVFIGFEDLFDSDVKTEISSPG
jgi:hypothetical protein